MRAEGHDVLIAQAAEVAATRAVGGAHCDLIKRFLPRPVALYFKDIPRLMFSRRFVGGLIEMIRRERPDCILETHVAQTVAGLTASRITHCRSSSTTWRAGGKRKPSTAFAFAA